MTRSSIRLLPAAAVACVVTLLIVLPCAATEVGPAKGALVVVGGNMHSPVILKRFIDLVGGPDQPIVIIPTAGEDLKDEKYDNTWSGLKEFREAGMTRLTVVQTRDRAVADSEAFVQPIRQARGVFFTGGRQWRIADAYLGTRTERELFAVLDRGGVIGGSSAGASIQGSYLVRGDTAGPEKVMGDHTRGLGFLRNVAIDQHLLKRNRQFDLIPLIATHQDLLGIGLDEDTAIIVQGDEFEVIGPSYVAIYDNQREIPPDGKFYFLQAGDRFNLATRQALRPGPKGTTTIDRVKDVKWQQPAPGGYR